MRAVAAFSKAEPASIARKWLPVADYTLTATLDSGQAFRWQPQEDGWWQGVVAGRWVRMRQVAGGIEAETLAVSGEEIPPKHTSVLTTSERFAPAIPGFPAQPEGWTTNTQDWRWLTHYLQTDVVLSDILATFPDDPHLRAAVAACRGLRLLRQDPWECLASFILSATKQIVQIRQIVARLCARYGEPVAVPAGQAPAFAFPAPQVLARVSEAELRGCQMGFRAPYLRAAARMVAGGELDLAAVAQLPEEAARRELLRVPGVGPKIANCVLLFAYGFPRAFPVDVWVRRALREAYFPHRAPGKRRWEKFLATYFGPHAGYAQQYLFHHIRTRAVTPSSPAGA